MSDITFLRNFPFFEHLNDLELAAIAPLFVTKTFAKGTQLFWEQDEGDELYMIKAGAVQIYRHEEDREVILAIFHEGDYFGEMALIDSTKLRSASAKVLEKSKLYVLKREQFFALLKENPGIAIHILGITLERLRKANELITDLTITNARTRISRLLLRLSDKYGTTIGLKLTHQQIADMTGTVRETVTKVLLEMQNEGYIRIVSKKISILNKEQLQVIGGIHQDSRLNDEKSIAQEG
ncbi:Crp/Fnr family transcriptional regulator [Paenibacillus sp. FSL H8-0537]|uniref:Crp/Fnr family transcriptional regulator n=1 Tax=Paenibacillus sp. FSL H8-0537 TaxID=2921399 RepID=UPI003101A169